MVAASENADSSGWYRRLIESLDPGDRVGELLFGLIMVLTFTLGAGVELAGDREATRILLIAALGCNVAWGIIDGVLYLISQLSERGRLHRLVQRVRSTPDREQALALVAREMEERMPSVVAQEFRTALDAHVLEQVREMKLAPNRVTADDLLAALAVFWLVFLTALPAIVPFLVIRDARVALRVSNAILVGLLFYVGWHWAGLTGARPVWTGAFVSALGIVLVVIAIALGG